MVLINSTTFTYLKNNMEKRIILTVIFGVGFGANTHQITFPAAGYGNYA